ncbi:MAG: manganese efflux pump MntP family protein [Betaproteobacteria bacterium]
MYLTTLFTALGLAMDAVAVSISSGMSVRNIRLSQALKMALCFGIMQAVMPWLGYLAGVQFRGQLEAYDHWVAFLLLGFLGVKLIRDSRGAGEEKLESPFAAGKLLLLGVATSIDALAVGVSFSLLAIGLLETVVTIGVVTFALCLPAVWFGAKLGKSMAKRADILGGVILIIMGSKILIEHLAAGI